MPDTEPRSVADSTEITPHEIAVSRSARYYTLGPTHGFPRELWFAAHGYGQLARRFLRAFTPLDDGTRLIVAPEALSRFYLDPLPQRRADPSPRIGATWMTREDRAAEIRDYIGYLDRVAAAVRGPLSGAAPRVVVLGFSQGTATVSRWLAASELRADHLVLWSGEIPPELDLEPWAESLQGASIHLVVGEGDPMVTPEAVTAQAERLSAAGVAFEIVRHPGGHAIDAQALQQLATQLNRPRSAPNRLGD